MHSVWYRQHSLRKKFDDIIHAGDTLSWYPYYNITEDQVHNFIIFIYPTDQLLHYYNTRSFLAEECEFEIRVFHSPRVVALQILENCYLSIDK